MRAGGGLPTAATVASCCCISLKRGTEPSSDSRKARCATVGTGFPHVRSAICAPMGGERSGVGVAGGGDAEQVEDLLLERVGPYPIL